MSNFDPNSLNPDFFNYASSQTKTGARRMPFGGRNGERNVRRIRFYDPIARMPYGALVAVEERSSLMQFVRRDTNRRPWESLGWEGVSNYFDRVAIINGFLFGAAKSDSSYGGVMPVRIQEALTDQGWVSVAEAANLIGLVALRRPLPGFRWPPSKAPPLLKVTPQPDLHPTSEPRATDTRVPAIQ